MQTIVDTRAAGMPLFGVFVDEFGAMQTKLPGIGIWHDIKLRWGGLDIDILQN